jgi:hypothetical protein
MVIRSALRDGRALLPGKISWSSFLLEAESTLDSLIFIDETPKQNLNILNFSAKETDSVYESKSPLAIRWLGSIRLLWYFEILVATQKPFL